MAYLQLDAPKYTYFDEPRLYPDPARRAEQLAEYVRTDLRVFADVPGVTTAIHVCRGNYRSMCGERHAVRGVRRGAVREARYDRLLLEYDDVRAGGFEALRFVPGGVTVVLGLVTTKRPDLENADELRRRIDAAARYVPLDRLALSSAVRLRQHLGGQRADPRRPTPQARPGDVHRHSRLGPSLAPPDGGRGIGWVGDSVRG